jgi:hypothetical protein
MTSSRQKKDISSIPYLGLYTGGLSTGKTIYFTSVNNWVEFISCDHDVIQRRDLVLYISHSAVMLQARDDDSVLESELSLHISISHKLQTALLFKTQSSRQNDMGHAAEYTRDGSNACSLF